MLVKPIRNINDQLTNVKSTGNIWQRKSEHLDFMSPDFYTLAFSYYILQME
jgi:hypothetical protein